MGGDICMETRVPSRVVLLLRPVEAKRVWEEEVVIIGNCCKTCMCEQLIMNFSLRTTRIVQAFHVRKR